MTPLFLRREAVDTHVMPIDDIVARLKALSERLERLRKQAQEVHNLASTEVRTAYTNSRQREVPNTTAEYVPDSSRT